MRTLKIPFPDIAYYDKTRLVGETNKVLSLPIGTGTIRVRNLGSFAVNDYMVLDAFESENAELVKIQAIETSTHDVTLVTATAQEHSIGAVVYKTPYNQVKIYKGTTSTVADHILLATVALRPSSSYTIYHDSIGATTDYYSYAYYNSTTTTTTDRSLYTDSNYDCVLTPENLKQWFMYGLDLTDDDGYPFPISMFEFAIKAAVDGLEKTIGVKLKPTTIVQEKQDYFINEYRDFAFIQLNEYPVISVESVSIKYPTAQAAITFPSDWIQANLEHGQIHLVPTSGSLSQILMGVGGDYLNFVWRGWEFMPNLWRINYTAGFPCGQVPYDLVGIVARMAAFYPLNIAGDLVGGIAIASKSIGIDGLSQNINTTSSAENAGYSARLRQYERELKIEIPRQVAFYKGLRMSVA